MSPTKKRNTGLRQGVYKEFEQVKYPLLPKCLGSVPKIMF